MLLLLFELLLLLQFLLLLHPFLLFQLRLLFSLLVLLDTLLFHPLLLLELFLLLESHHLLLMMKLLLPLLHLLLRLLRLLRRLRLRLRLSLLAQSKHGRAGHGRTSRGVSFPRMHTRMRKPIQRLLGRWHIHTMLMRHRSWRSHARLLAHMRYWVKTSLQVMHGHRI